MASHPHPLSAGGSWELVEPLGWPLGPLGMASEGISALAEPWETPSLSGPAQLEITDTVTGWMWVKPRIGATQHESGLAESGHPLGAGHLSLPQGPLPQTLGLWTQTTQFWCEDRGIPVV